MEIIVAFVRGILLKNLFSLSGSKIIYKGLDAKEII